MWESFAEFLSNAGNWWDGFTAWWNSLDWEQIKEAFTIGLGAISALLTIVCFMLKRTGKKEKIATANKIQSFNNICQSCVCEAEAFKTYTGEQKKAYALQRIKNECEAKGIDFTEEEISDTIEAIISLSKTVNYKSRR